MTDDERLADALAVVRAAGVQVIVPPPPNKCFKCGREEGPHEYSFTDITVEIAVSAEGHDHVRRYVCDDDLADVQEQLVSLGFGVHRHGGIHYLEAMECPGFVDPRACRTPEDDDERERWHHYRGDEGSK